MMQGFSSVDAKQETGKVEGQCLMVPNECEVGLEAGLGSGSPGHYTSLSQVSPQEASNRVWAYQEQFFPKVNWSAPLPAIWP